GPDQYFEQLAGVRVGIVTQPEHAGLVKQLLIVPLGQFLPAGQGARRPARVELVGAVAHADDARLPARTGAAVAGTIRIQQCDAGATAAKMVGGPGTKNAGANYGEIVSFIHRLQFPKIRTLPLINTDETDLFSLISRQSPSSLSSAVRFC